MVHIHIINVCILYIQKFHIHVYVYTYIYMCVFRMIAHS